MKKELKFFEKKYIGKLTVPDNRLVFAVPCDDGFFYGFIQQEDKNSFVKTGTEPRKTEAELIEEMKKHYDCRGFTST